MKKFLILSVLVLSLQCSSYTVTTGQVSTFKPSEVQTFSNEENLFGLKTKDETVLVEPMYKKLIRLGDSSWIVQKNTKFGLIDYNGNILVPIKYSHVERVLGKYLKIGNGSKYALYDEHGKEILPREYSSIDLLFGGMLLTCKDFKYGIVDMEGNTILENKFDDIYMPQPNIMRINYNGQWYEIEQAKGETLALPQNIKDIKGDENFKISELIAKPGTATGYSVVTFTDYFLKIFSSISPAHEKTIDELMLSQGADTVSIFMKLGWIPKYPFTYARNYYYTVRTPNNGPLSEVKYELKRRLQ